MTPDEILDQLQELFPYAQAELHYRNSFELLIAVILSAQTTDVRVNLTTPKLFAHYPTPLALSQADTADVEKDIKEIGLYRNKAKNIVGCAKMLCEIYGGQVPQSRTELMKLPGVGRKTANVVLSVAFDIPALAVDTHVDRVSKRLRLAKPSDSVEQVEQKLMRKIPHSRWNKAHHLFIFFGRYQCKSQNPKCEGCPFASFCLYQKALKDKKKSASSVK